MSTALFFRTIFAEESTSNPSTFTGGIVERTTQMAKQLKIISTDVLGSGLIKLSEFEKTLCYKYYLSLLKKNGRQTEVSSSDDLLSNIEAIKDITGLIRYLYTLRDVLDINKFDASAQDEIATKLAGVHFQGKDTGMVLDIFLNVLPENSWKFVGPATMDHAQVEAALIRRNHSIGSTDVGDEGPTIFARDAQNVQNAISKVDLGRVADSVSHAFDRALTVAEEGAHATTTGLGEFTIGLAASAQAAVEQPIDICREEVRSIRNGVKKACAEIMAAGHHLREKSINIGKSGLDIGKRLFLGNSDGFRMQVGKLIRGEIRPSIAHLINNEKDDTSADNSHILDKFLDKREQALRAREEQNREKEVLALTMHAFFQKNYGNMGTDFAEKCSANYAELVYEFIGASSDETLKMNLRSGKARLKDASHVAVLMTVLDGTMDLGKLPQKEVIKIAIKFATRAQGNTDRDVLKRDALALLIQEVPEEHRLAMINACGNRPLLEEVITAFNADLSKPSNGNKVAFKEWLDEQLPAIQKYLRGLPSEEAKKTLQWTHPLSDLKLPPRKWFDKESQKHTSPGFDVKRGGGYQAFEATVIKWAHDNHILPPLDQLSEKSRSIYTAAVSQLIGMVV